MVSGGTHQLPGDPHPNMCTCDSWWHALRVVGGGWWHALQLVLTGAVLPETTAATEDSLGEDVVLALAEAADAAMGLDNALSELRGVLSHQAMYSLAARWCSANEARA